MADEQLAFARRASGLVRGLSMWDAFGVGFMNQGLTPSIWVMVSFGVGVYTGGNLWIATLLSLVFCGIGFPIVWGVLGSSMPRSGGEYIYNSRVLHPIVGLAQSFGEAVMLLMWIYLLCPWTADPGLTMIAGFMGWQGLADFAVTPWAVFVIATVSNIFALLLAVFGMKIFAAAQKVFMVVGIGSVVLMTIVMCLYNQTDFHNAWNQLATQYNSLDYDSFLAAVNTAAGEPMPSTWNWFDTFGVMVAGSWLFAYSYYIAFIGGEVKRPDKTIIWANVLSVVTPVAFMLWTAIALYHMVPFNFLSATAWLDNAGTDVISGYNLPWSSHYVGLLAVVNQNKLVLFLAGSSFIVFNQWWVTLSYMAFPRLLFAWGMDRMGPKWFTDISPRFASPVKNNLLLFALGEITIGVYVFWTNNPMQSLTMTAFEVVFVWGVTAVSALVFPYRRRVRGIWESSPYKNWRLFGIPVVSLGAVVDIVYLGILAYFFFVMPESRDFTTGSGILYVVTAMLGVLWYFYFKWRSRRVGVDVSITYGELPPE
jgi:amino acid transporter